MMEKPGFFPSLVVQSLECYQMAVWNAHAVQFAQGMTGYWLAAWCQRKK